MITEEHFIRATGEVPVSDDLERANCNLAGEPMHESCGWNHIIDFPNFYYHPNARKSEYLIVSNNQIVGIIYDYYPPDNDLGIIFGDRPCRMNSMPLRAKRKQLREKCSGDSCSYMEFTFFLGRVSDVEYE